MRWTATIRGNGKTKTRAADGAVNGKIELAEWLPGDTYPNAQVPSYEGLKPYWHSWATYHVASFCYQVGKPVSFVDPQHPEIKIDMAMSLIPSWGHPTGYNPGDYIYYDAYTQKELTAPFESPMGCMMILAVNLTSDITPLEKIIPETYHYNIYKYDTRPEGYWYVPQDINGNPPDVSGMKYLYGLIQSHIPDMLDGLDIDFIITGSDMYSFGGSVSGNRQIRRPQWLTTGGAGGKYPPRTEWYGPGYRSFKNWLQRANEEYNPTYSTADDYSYKAYVVTGDQFTVTMVGYEDPQDKAKYLPGAGCNLGAYNTTNPGYAGLNSPLLPDAGASWGKVPIYYFGPYLTSAGRRCYALEYTVNPQPRYPYTGYTLGRVIGSNRVKIAFDCPINYDDTQKIFARGVRCMIGMQGYPYDNPQFRAKMFYEHDPSQVPDITGGDPVV